MPFFQWQQIDPTPAALTQAVIAAGLSASLAGVLGQEPAGSIASGRGVVTWWTDAIGRRHWYIEADEYHLQGEPHPLWRCLNGPAILPLLVIAPRHAVQVGDDLEAHLLVACDCGEVGTPEGLGWMGECCGPCHDRLAEGGWTPPHPRAFQPHRSSVTGLAFLEDGRIATCGDRDGYFVVYDPETGQETRHEVVSQGGAAGLAVLPDGCVVVAFSRRRVVAWGAFIGEEIWRSDCPDDLVGVAASPRGDLIAVDAVSQTYLIDADSGRGHSLSDDYSRFTFSFDGGIMYACDSASRSVVTVDQMNLQQHETGLAFGEPEEDDCYSLASHPTRRLLACGGGLGRVRLGDPEKGAWLWRRDGPPGLVAHLAFPPGGQTLASSHGDVVAFWQVDTGEVVGQVRIPGHGVGALAFSPDGETLAVGDAQGVVRLFPWRQLLAVGLQ